MIVVGLGALGSAVCAQLATRSVAVVGIDRFAPPHPWGSTHGDTRITRVAIGEGREYVPFAQRSHELWRELEQQTGVQLLHQAGIVILASPASTFLRETEAAAHEYAVEHELLPNAEVRARFPMFAIDERTVGYLEPGGGYVRPEAAVAAQLQVARHAGAELRLGVRVLRWTASRSGVTVQTDAGEYVAEQLVICAGPWIGELLPEARDLFAVYEQHLYWFPIRHGYAQLREMPTFVWELGDDRQEFVHLDGFYGFPAIDGPGGGLKVATESYERTTTPDGRQHEPARRARRRMYDRCVGPHLPWLGPEPLRTVSCLYTCTRDSRFVIDRHPEHDAIMIVSACSGHGFKHSPAIGEAVAQGLTGSRVELDLGPFGFERSRR